MTVVLLCKTSAIKITFLFTHFHCQHMVAGAMDDVHFLYFLSPTV
jgi:hypothetical protein